MICGNCGIEIPAKFKAALKSNACPACEGRIIADMEAFNYLKKDLSNIELSLDKSETIERIALYILQNYKIKPLAITKPKKLKRADELEEDEEYEEEDEEEEDDDPDEDLEELVRDQIYQEVEEEIYGKDEDEEDVPDDRVARLKKKMKNGKKFLKKNITIQKIGS